MARAAIVMCLASSSPIPPNQTCPNSNNHPSISLSLTRRKYLHQILTSSLLCSSVSTPIAAQPIDEFEQYQTQLVQIFQETSPSVVFIQDLSQTDQVQGTGSGFIWDQFGHIVTNYHVVSKLATDTTGLHRCKINLVDSGGNNITKEGKIVGFDPDFDLAVVKVDVVGNVLKAVSIGRSGDLRVGQSCFAVGNPYGYNNTLTTGVISGLGREIPSPNGRAIRGAIQTDAAINAGNSGGPLIDSYGHVIGVNTATFTRKGSGISSGVNFAIPIDTAVRIVPYLIVYGTPYKDRY